MYRKKKQNSLCNSVIVNIMRTLLVVVQSPGKLKGVIDELPPGVVSRVDSNGLYLFVKLLSQCDSSCRSVVIRLEKIMFQGCEAVTNGSDLPAAADVISNRQI